MRKKVVVKIAKHIRTLDRGIQIIKLYKLTPALDGYDYVVVSAIKRAFDTNRSETFIFGANKKGEIINYSEMGASQRDTTNHEKVLRESGYKVKM